jgi:hypothetical protein
MKKTKKALFGIYGIVRMIDGEAKVEAKNVSEIVSDIRRYKKQNAGVGIVKGNRVKSLMGEYVIASRCYCNPADAVREAKFMEVK